MRSLYKADNRHGHGRIVLATEEVESNDEPAGVRDKPVEDWLDGCEAVLEEVSPCNRV